MITKIRNFCIIAHIDHGKSTLADRLLEITQTVSQREMKEQLLDTMELERERGITIKLQPVRLSYKDYILNLIDTPGHVDFTYEVSRSLAAVEGALLVVDATQGIQAQTLTNLYLAMEHDLTLIPVINKVDLPNANIPKVKQEIISLLGCQESEILEVSAKTGLGVDKVLETIVQEIPPPQGDPQANCRALVFDSIFDEYQGVISYLRVVDGTLKLNDKISYYASQKKGEVLNMGVFLPQSVAKETLETGEIGYVVSGLKDLKEANVGDTIFKTKTEIKPLAGYQEVIPMVYAGIFPKDASQFNDLEIAMAKLALNDSSLIYEKETSSALGFGYRCGFLGLLHLDIIQERLKREYSLELIITAPSVPYKVTNRKGEEKTIHLPPELPNPTQIEKITEPWVKVELIAPTDYLGKIMQLVANYRGIFKETKYLSQEGDRVMLMAEFPLAALLVDFYDTLKSVSAGYATMSYELLEYRVAKVVKLDVLIAEDQIDALSTIAYQDTVQQVARKIVLKLKEVVPQQQYVVKLQASVGGKVIASERLSALRKDVTSKLYGGDVTRKRKLLEKQKKGKKRLQSHGKINLPTKVFWSLLQNK